jgi:hypothetical protein
MTNLSFQDAEKIIRERPKEADALTFASQEYFKTHSEDSPSDIPQSVLDGKAISEAYSYLREQHEDSQMSEENEIDQSKIPQYLTAVPLLAAAFLVKPKIIEDDKSYKKIEENLKKEWLKQNSGKDFSSKEGLDYLYGSLDDRTKTSLHGEAEAAFRNNSKFKKRIERYDKEAKKIYKNRKADPKVQLFERNAQLEITARIKLQEKTRNKQIEASREDIKKSQNEIINRVNRKYLREFAQNYREKTDIYHEKIKLEREKFRDGAGFRVNINTPSMKNVTLNMPTSNIGYSSSPSQPLGARGGRGININNFMGRGFKNLFGKSGSKAVVQTALRGFSAFLTGPGLPIAIALILVVLFTIMIVGFGGVPMSTPDNQTTNTTQ